MKVMYSAQNGKAWKEERGVRKQIQVRDARPPLVVISRSMVTIRSCRSIWSNWASTRPPQSVRRAEILHGEGQAQLYPRFGPTSTWDTAAGHAVAVAAGAHVHDWQGKPSTTRRVNPSSTPASASLFIGSLCSRPTTCCTLLASAPSFAH